MDWNPPNLLENFEIAKKLIDDHNKEEEVLDLSRIEFLTPTTLLPILHYARKNTNNITEFNLHPQTTKYVKRVLGITKHTNYQYV